MNELLFWGTRLVVLALISYSIAIISEQRSHVVSSRVLTFVTLGVTLDISATILMILGSSKGGWTLHGVIGYSSLLAMSIDTLLLWQHYKRSGANAKVSGWLHQYSRYAYVWWVLAFITGGLLVALRP